jgi:DNA polymerase-1
MEKKSPKLILIDGNAIIHRAYHALPPLTNKKGELLNAVYGFASTVLSVIDKFKPDYVIATFDLAGPTFRHVQYKDYKATRAKADQALYDQIPRVKEVTAAMGIPILEREGFEADDTIGTSVKFLEKNNPEIENIIVTGDLDTLQLVSSQTKVYTMRRGLTDSVLYDLDSVFARYQLKPAQLIDFKGLRGDASDNIPGVKGIGEKTAIELLKKYGTLENVYKNLGEIKGAVKEKLERDKEIARQSKDLATIRTDAPVEVDLEKARVDGFDREKLIELFQELNFFSLVKRIPGSDTNLRMHANATNSSNGVKDFKYEYIAADKLDEFIKLLKEQKEIAIKLKTVGQKYHGNELRGLAVSWKTGRAGYVAFGELKGKSEKLKVILEDENIKKIGYDLKYDLEVLGKYGIKLRGLDFDVMLGAYVLDPGAAVEFERLVLEEIGDELSGENKKGQLGLEIESAEEAAQKVCRRADYIFKLKNIYAEKIKTISQAQGKNNLETLFSALEMPLIPVLAEMETRGVKLNKTIFQGISEKIEKRIEKLEESIYKLAGGQFNINSPRQLAEILFTKLQLPTFDIKKGKTGYSTASAELEKLRSEHEIIEKIEEYREIFKLKTTYLDALPELCDERSRIHTTFNQAVTATGRLSSSDPNLQNIPTRTDLGQLLRVAFEADVGNKLIAADYSQIDLRVMAHVSGDKKLRELFYAGEDIHRATAALINNVTLSQVTDKMRRGAKELNFGVIYGISPFGFAMRAGVDRDQAKKFIDQYFERFPGVAAFMKKTKGSAKKNSYVETELGRRRNIPEINSPNFQVQSAAERMAINLPIQGLSADIMKLAMIKVAEVYKNNLDVAMLLQIHDEIILEVKENLAEAVAKKVKEIMENAYQLSVPLVVDVKIGDNWGEV